MMRNRTKSSWFPAALAIALAFVVSPTVDASIGGDSFRGRQDKRPWTPPTRDRLLAHGNNGAPPTPDSFADTFEAYEQALVPDGDLLDGLIKPDPGSNHLGRPGSSEPGALGVLPGSPPSTGLGGPSFFAPRVGGSPIGQPMSAVPSPGTLALLGLSALALARRRRRT